MNSDLVTVIATLLTPTGIIALALQQWLKSQADKTRFDAQRLQTIADAEMTRAEAGRLSAELALKIQVHAEATRRTVENTAESASAERKQATAEMAGKIEENTSLTLETKREARAAYVAANSVNEKLADIGVQMKDGRPL